MNRLVGNIYSTAGDFTSTIFDATLFSLGEARKKAKFLHLDNTIGKEQGHSYFVYHKLEVAKEVIKKLKNHELDELINGKRIWRSPALLNG